MDEFNKSFELILHAGNSKSHSMEAVKESREYNFQLAEDYMKKAKEELTLAHKIQTDLIQKEARGDKIYIDILMIHAQDHLSNALLMRELAEEIMRIYKCLNNGVSS